MIPDLSQPGTRRPGIKLELAKRRLVYSLLLLGCPCRARHDDPEHGLAFEFLADPDDPEPRPS